MHQYMYIPICVGGLGCSIENPVSHQRWYLALRHLKVDLWRIKSEKKTYPIKVPAEVNNLVMLRYLVHSLYVRLHQSWLRKIFFHVHETSKVTLIYQKNRSLKRIERTHEDHIEWWSVSRHQTWLWIIAWVQSYTRLIPKLLSFKR